MVTSKPFLFIILQILHIILWFCKFTKIIILNSHFTIFSSKDINDINYIRLSVVEYIIDRRFQSHKSRSMIDVFYMWYTSIWIDRLGRVWYTHFWLFSLGRIEKKERVIENFIDSILLSPIEDVYHL